MMRWEYQILTALILDLLIGDPRWFPHPVRFIGGIASRLEKPFRRLIGPPRIAGLVTAITVVLVVALATLGFIHGAGWVHPIAKDVAATLVIYMTIAAKDLAGHSMNVYRALKSGDLPEARQRVSWMVGRDTERLDESGVIRATVESVAENSVDGVIAPLFYAVLGGPVGAMAYKAVSTLDSTFGYKNERYAEFGWASARIDDLANFIPARLTVPLIAMAAAFLRFRPADSLRVCLRDGRKHSSPNAGLSESAFAGALGIQLGGPLFRGGGLVKMPFLGEPIFGLDRGHIRMANALMFVTLALASILFVGMRMLVSHLLS
jgi:adenosylcobinamide-phosphate synthase